MTLSWIQQRLVKLPVFLTWRRQPHLLDMTCQAMFAWLVTVISVLLLLKCLHGGKKGPSLVLDGFWKESLLRSLNQTYHKNGTSIFGWPDVRSGQTDHQCQEYSINGYNESQGLWTRL